MGFFYAQVYKFCGNFRKLNFKNSTNSNKCKIKEDKEAEVMEEEEEEPGEAEEVVEEDEEIAMQEIVEDEEDPNEVEEEEEEDVEALQSTSLLLLHKTCQPITSQIHTWMLSDLCGLDLANWEAR